MFIEFDLASRLPDHYDVWLLSAALFAGIVTVIMIVRTRVLWKDGLDSEDIFFAVWLRPGVSILLVGIILFFLIWPYEELQEDKLLYPSAIMILFLFTVIRLSYAVRFVRCHPRNK